MKMKRNLGLVILSSVSYAMVSLSIIAMSFDNVADSGGISTLGIVCGVCFWAFLLTGIVLQIATSVSVKRWYKKHGVYRLGKRKLAVISFFSNLPALISDIVFFLSLLVFLALIIFTDGTSLLAYVSISVLFLSFCAHCIFNGKNYYYIRNCKKIKKD